GGRSGNRGECAQPCRLPYKKCAEKAKDTYALSIKDMCLASHITKILSLGAASLKIEGRMKSPEYVYGVTAIYRRLLDERRNASPEELAELRALFSRSGFTDGYFTGKIGREMLGIRTDADKADTAAGTKPADYGALMKNRRRPLSLSLTLAAGKPAALTVRSGEFSASVTGAIPDEAKTCPLTVEAVTKNLTKLGNTPFFAESAEVTLDDGLMMPVSALNALRRDAVDALSKKLFARREAKLPGKIEPPQTKPGKPLRTARFHSYERIPADTAGFDIVYLPLEKFRAGMCDRVSGVILPPVIFDSERSEVAAMLKTAADAGIRHALVSNLGHLRLAAEAGMIPHGDFRLNIYNGWTVDALFELGFADLMASPELTLPQLRDLGLPTVIYGRIPLMLLEKCVIRDLYSCEECKKHDFLAMRDRKNAKFPLARTYEHRNILYNSVPVYMADRMDSRIADGHFIFTDESAKRASDINAAYMGKLTITPPDGGIRRIAK
ncbi:MAG: U32 family peptidase, partial [Ruminococcaceae bacterium]|nr:U32 family peptidase [Oscillospiraceae bacterium]